ncbi:8073_t:CDS:2 [Funneliformis geosporum]|uniref:5438_t:CDS:1 n=1 Tax=Funneliformis geosporum TaxID=1117311 RepID=A0A9W4SR95_9GLOM|nr:5438_t:CDS:2 [Funneliformis geosporum]CAI2180386.1 8073_t:CDS:2 [Funneliformis geosporum]
MENWINCLLEEEHTKCHIKYVNFLRNFKNNVEIFFAGQLSEAIEILSNEKFRELFNGLENGINKFSFYNFKKRLELIFAKDLENDINCGIGGIGNTFGLKEILLCNKEFDDEFEEVEGLFNKLDLKTHTNMSLSLEQSKLRLASSLMEGLEKIRAQEKSNIMPNCPIASYSATTIWKEEEARAEEFSRLFERGEEWWR